HEGLRWPLWVSSRSVVVVMVREMFDGEDYCKGRAVIDRAPESTEGLPPARWRNVRDSNAALVAPPRPRARTGGGSADRWCAAATPVTTGAPRGFVRLHAGPKHPYDRLRAPSPGSRFAADQARRRVRPSHCRTWVGECLSCPAPFAEPGG